MLPIYLASTSPRRRELIRLLNVQCETLSPCIDEIRRDDEPAADYVVRLAREKAQAGVALAAEDRPVIGSYHCGARRGYPGKTPGRGACFCYAQRIIRFHTPGDDSCRGF